MSEPKQTTPEQMLQKTITDFRASHTTADVIAALEFLVLAGILPSGYTLSITFGTPQPQETETGKEE